MKTFDLVVATNNNHKIIEIKKILSPYGINVYSLKEKGLYPEDVDENGSSYFENAVIKANSVAKLTKLPVIADDSGIEILSMDNKPGLHTARYANSFKNTYKDAFKEIYKNIEGKDRSARFMCTIALVNVENKPIEFTGIVPGHINYEPVGENGFGYDPIFVCDEVNKCYALLSEDEKNNVSHRGKALKLLIKYLKEHNLID